MSNLSGAGFTGDYAQTMRAAFKTLGNILGLHSRAANARTYGLGERAPQLLEEITNLVSPSGTLAKLNMPKTLASLSRAGQLALDALNGAFENVLIQSPAQVVNAGFQAAKDLLAAPFEQTLPSSKRPGLTLVANNAEAPHLKGGPK
jgi:hypothetical protein